jgi:hypothetical protein
LPENQIQIEPIGRICAPLFSPPDDRSEYTALAYDRPVEADSISDNRMAILSGDVSADDREDFKVRVLGSHMTNALAGSKSH